MTMTSSRPYIIRALYDWIVENECTPYLLVDAEWPGVMVPPGSAENGQVVLNVAPMAVRELMLENDAVSFMARFGGRSCNVYVPVAGVMAIYARENGQGMVFEMDEHPEGDEADEDDILADEPKAPSHLTAVSDSSAGFSSEQSPEQSSGKASEQLSEAASEKPAVSPAPSPLKSVAEKPPGDGDDKPEPPKPGKGRPSLKVIK